MTDHTGRQALADRIRREDPSASKRAAIQHILAVAIWCVPSAIWNKPESLARLVEGSPARFELPCECLQAIRCVLDMETLNLRVRARSLEGALAVQQLDTAVAEDVRRHQPSCSGLTETPDAELETALADAMAILGY